MDLYDVIKEMDNMFGGIDGQQTTRYSVPSFPPCDAVLNKDESMTFAFALAGYKKEDLGIDYENNYLCIFTKEGYSGTKFSKENTKKILSDRIKTSSFSYKYYVPETKFDPAELKATFEDGILKITIPAKVQTKQKTIFTID